MKRQYKILQLLPGLDHGGVEQGVVQISRYMTQLGHDSLVMSREGRLVPGIIDNGGQHIVRDIGAKNPFKLVQNIAFLKSFIRKNKIDLVHARSRMPAWAAYFATRTLKVPFVTTFHGVYGLTPPLKKYYNQVMAKADRVIAVSQFIENHVKDHYDDYLGKAALVRIERGIDLSFFDPQTVSDEDKLTLRQQWHVPPGKKIVLMPGRIRRIKGHDVVIQAISQLPESLRDQLILVFLGPANANDPFFNELKSQVAASPIAAQIRFAPPTLHMNHAYGASDVVIQGARWPESFGRTVVEAMAMRKPVIGANIGAIPELIATNTGWIFDPENPGHLAAQLKEVFTTSPAKLDLMSKAAIKHVKEHFSQDRMLSRTVDLYDELITKAAQEKKSV